MSSLRYVQLIRIIHVNYMYYDTLYDMTSLNANKSTPTLIALLAWLVRYLLTHLVEQMACLLELSGSNLGLAETR